jgi:hypothetical protein
MQTTLLGIISVDFDGTCHLLAVCSAVITYLRKNGSTVWHLFTDFKKTLSQLRVRFEPGIPVKLVGLIKACLNETYSTLQEDKQLSDAFCIKNSLKEGDASLPLF